MSNRRAHTRSPPHLAKKWLRIIRLPYFWQRPASLVIGALPLWEQVKRLQPLEGGKPFVPNHDTLVGEELQRPFVAKSTVSSSHLLDRYYLPPYRARLC